MDVALNPKVVTDLMYFAALGMDIVQPDTDEFWENLSWEEANKYAADLILNDVRTQALTPDQLAAKPTWAGLPAVKAGQVGPWYFEVTYSHKSYATVLEAIATVIKGARADVV